MSEALTKFELKKQDLELIVNEKTLGSLTTNAKQIKAMVESALPNYDISNYDEGNIDLAKKDKAMLNNASKALNGKRILFEREFMQPFAEFKTVVNETIALITKCSAKIDTVVKQSEENERKKKQQKIDAIWNIKGISFVPLSKVSDPKWLNKGTKLKAIEADIDAKIAKINDDIVTIEAIGEYVELLKSLYLDTLNLNSTIQYARTLKENRERAKAEAEARAKAEAERKERAAQAKAAYEAEQESIRCKYEQPESAVDANMFDAVEEPAETSVTFAPAPDTDTSLFAGFGMPQQESQSPKGMAKAVITITDTIENIELLKQTLDFGGYQYDIEYTETY